MDFVYAGIEGDEAECTLHEADEKHPCGSIEEEVVGSFTQRKGGRSKHRDPMYQRSLDGKGVYGVQLFDFARKVNVDDGNNVFGGGKWECSGGECSESGVKN